MSFDKELSQIIAKSLASRDIDNCFEQQFLYKHQFESIIDPKNIVHFLQFAIKSRIIQIYDKNSLFFNVFYEETQEKLVIQQISNPQDLEELSVIYKNNLESNMASEIKNLTEPSFICLLENILNDDKIPFIRNFVLSDKITGDGGVDFKCEVLIDSEEEKISCTDNGRWYPAYGQSKHQKDRVPIGKINEFIGALDIKSEKYGIFITSGGLTGNAKEAMKASSNHLIFSIELKDICKWMIDGEIGIKTITIGPILDTDTDWWRDIKTITLNL